ncbi:MAG: hypothetical protein GXP03_08050 [Alphaproteobacteria bacterium]|nr:hypothetical protein [Alphaproteobacteria bacterium]
MFSKIMVSLGLVAALSVFSAGVAEAKVCKSSVYKAPFEGRTAANLKVSAQTRARLRWQTRMTEKFGVKWASWGLAVDRRQSCIRSGGKWRCIAYARPCK